MQAQLALFSDDREPPGLYYHPDFISEEEEHMLIGHFDDLPLAPFQFGAFEGKRRVASFGWRYDFSDQRLHTAEPLPFWIIPVAARAEAFAALSTGAIQHELCAEYAAKRVIGCHRDKAHFD